jgi:hypothetical protein
MHRFAKVCRLGNELGLRDAESNLFPAVGQQQGAEWTKR